MNLDFIDFLFPALTGLAGGAILPPCLYLTRLGVLGGVFNVLGFLYYCAPAWLLIMSFIAPGDTKGVLDMPLAMVLMLGIFGGVEYLSYAALRAIRRVVERSLPDRGKLD